MPAGPRQGGALRKSINTSKHAIISGTRAKKSGSAGSVRGSSDGAGELDHHQRQKPALTPIRWVAMPRQPVARISADHRRQGNTDNQRDQIKESFESLLFSPDGIRLGFEIIPRAASEHQQQPDSIGTVAKRGLRAKAAVGNTAA